MFEVVVMEDLRNHKIERKIGGKQSTHAGTDIRATRAGSQRGA